MKIVLASNNLKKINEFKELFKNTKIEIIPQSELEIPEVEETGLTFIENAILKARHAAYIAQMPAIADDSGLVVDILHGAPGIYSARYAGEKASDDDNMLKLLAGLKLQSNRQAHYHCVLAFMSHDKDPTPIIAEGKWYGEILEAPRGQYGFGYDPIFYVKNEQKTAAELLPDVKNKLSHRGQALQQLLKLITEKL